MSLFKQMKDESKTKVMDIVDSSVDMILAMQKTEKDLFNTIIDYSTFENYATLATNEVVSKAIDGTLAQVSKQTELLFSLDSFIALHIPTIEDGGNFGVGVQLDLVKKLGEMKEAANKATEALYGYESARADALAKLNLPSKTQTATMSTVDSKSDGKPEKKESITTEEKETKSPPSGPVYDARVKAVVAVDSLYMSKASVIFTQSIISLMAVMDFVDKNKEKLFEPKGKMGGSSFSMY